MLQKKVIELGLERSGNLEDERKEEKKIISDKRNECTKGQRIMTPFWRRAMRGMV